MLTRLLSIPLLLILSSAAVAGVDLATVERHIAREPAYRSKPKYCLLVLGPEAKTRIWLIQDGDTLYVDRNGNGDLTEADERIAAEKNDDAEDGVYTFKAGDLSDGDRLHKGLTLSIQNIDAFAGREDAVREFLKKNPKGRGYSLVLDVEMPGHRGNAIGGRVQQRTSVVDGTGVLQFADRPQDAPIVHFGGPFQIALFGSHQLTLDRETDVSLGVGTRGLGPGTFTWTDYENVIPTDKFPTLDLVYPPKHPGDPPLREHYELKKRC